MSIFSKLKEAIDVGLDSFIAKAKSDDKSIEEELSRRKAVFDIDYQNSSTGFYQEWFNSAGPGTLRNMARRNSVIVAIHQSLINQVSNFAQPQVDKYSPGFRFRARKPADLTREEKMELNDPSLDEEAWEKKKFELEKRKAERQEQQDREIAQLTEFITYCGYTKEEVDAVYKRMDFDKFVKIITRDRLTYNYCAIEMIPTRDGTRLHSFYPVSAGSIRFVTSKSRDHYENTVVPAIHDYLGEKANHRPATKDVPYRYVQVARGKPVAVFRADELVFEPANPSVDIEDKYAPGELEWLIVTVTSLLFAEAHNRNFFSQGLSQKGLLHIKGDSISRAQLEGFKRQWHQQIVNSKNAFRPPIIGMADEVKWISLSQSNREMEFANWLEYLIKIACAIYGIDPSEINFDISKSSNVGSLNESSNEQRIKSSRTKGLRPLLMYLQNIINNFILPRYSKELANKYVFEFVGLEAETKIEEVDRFQKEVQVYKTVNEIRTEQGLPPIEDGDIVLNATYTQYRQMKLANEAQEIGMTGEEGVMGDGSDQVDVTDLQSELEQIITEIDDDDEGEITDEKEETKKSMIIEYHHFDD